MLFVLRSCNINTGVMIMDNPFAEKGIMRMDQGDKLEVPIPPVQFVINENAKGEVLDFVWITAPTLLISARFRSVLDQYCNNIDYYPATILDKRTNYIHEDYYMINIIGMGDCMDMENSVYEYSILDPDMVQDIDNLRIDYSKVPDLKIFRLKNSFTVILIQEELVRAIEERQLTGVRFIEADGYSE